jgi:hypothetical protein
MTMTGDKKDGPDERKSRWSFGSLRDALSAAGREHDKEAADIKGGGRPSTIPLPEAPAQKPRDQPKPAAQSAPPSAPVVAQSTMPPALKPQAAQTSLQATPQPVPAKEPIRTAPAPKSRPAEKEQRTELIRGRQKVVRNKFHQDPVVGWLVVIGGPGLGAFRPIFEGNNTVGRASAQRIPIDFGDESISGEEQAYLRYDSTDRKFLFVPNLAKTNVVQVNDKKPTGAVELQAMDVITMGRTQLVFVPFCGEAFDWSELTELKA